jgi:hypothetical protein
MSATPAQVANDLDAQANYFGRRDEAIATACRDCARIIRAFIAAEQVAAQAYGDLRRHMLDLEIKFRNQTHSQIGKSICRGRQTLETMSAELVV